MGGHAERRRRPPVGDRRGGPGGVERAGQQHLAAGQQGVDREAQRGAVVQRGEHEVPVGGLEAPELDLLGGQPPGVVLGQDAGPHALAPPRRPGRVVHGPGQRHVGELGLVVPEQLPGIVAQVERRIGVLGERGPLGRGQPGVEDDGDDAGAQRPEDGGDQRRRGGGGDQQPVAGAAPPGRPGPPPPAAGRARCRRS